MLNSNDSSFAAAGTAAGTASSPRPGSAAPGVVASPPKALHNVMRRQISGRLTIRDVNGDGAAWVVYAGQGQLHFVTSTAGERSRLKYILQRTRSRLLAQVNSGFQTTAYDFLQRGYETGQITQNQLSTFLRLFSQEALIHVLSMPQAVIQFDRDMNLDPISVFMPLKELISPIATQIGAWQRLRPEISSPLQHLEILDRNGFDQDWIHQLGSLITEPPRVSLANVLEDQPSLYQLAYRLKLDILQLAKITARGVESGILGMVIRTGNEAQAAKETVICIDDSVTVQRNVKLILEAAGYRVLGLTNPLQALSSLAKEKPSLILMDISMPNLDGYELCRLLRQSALLKDMPIVMLTGRDGFIDKVRAKVAGSTDYITKPFDAQTLMETVAKHIRAASS